MVTDALDYETRSCWVRSSNVLLYFPVLSINNQRYHSYMKPKDISGSLSKEFMKISSIADRKLFGNKIELRKVNTYHEYLR